MPPYALWLRGREEILSVVARSGRRLPGLPSACPPRANGAPAFGQYRPSGPGGAHRPWALQVLRTSGDRIVELTFFLSTESLFPLFGLPEDPAELEQPGR